MTRECYEFVVPMTGVDAIHRFSARATFNTLFLSHSPAPRPASPKLRRPTAPSPSPGLQA